MLLPKNNREAYYTGNLTPKLVLIFTPWHFTAVDDGKQQQIWSKNLQEPSCQFLLLNGVSTVFVWLKISKTVRAEDRAQKFLEESGSLPKVYWGTPSSAFLILEAWQSISPLPSSLLLKNSPSSYVQGKAECFWDPQPHFTSTPISGKQELHLKLWDMLFNLWRPQH